MFSSNYPTARCHVCLWSSSVFLCRASAQQPTTTGALWFPLTARYVTKLVSGHSCISSKPVRCQTIHTHTYTHPPITPLNNTCPCFRNLGKWKIPEKYCFLTLLSIISVCSLYTTLKEDQLQKQEMIRIRNIGSSWKFAQFWRKTERKLT